MAACSFCGASGDGEEGWLEDHLEVCRSAPVPCPARSPRPPPCPSLPPQHAPDLPRKSSEIEAALCSDSRACAYPMPGRTAAGRSYRGGRSRRTCPSAPRAACCAAIPRCVRRCGGCPQESAAAPPPPRGSLRARPWHTNCPMPHATLKTEESRREGEKRLFSYIFYKWRQPKFCAWLPPLVEHVVKRPFLADAATSFGAGGHSGQSGAFFSPSP
jgi:hypothetical protein